MTTKGRGGAMFKKDVGELIETLIDTSATKATKYIDYEYVMKATRKLFGGKIRKMARTIDIVLTIGKPNFEERATIKKFLAVREPFPVKKIQLKFPAR